MEFFPSHSTKKLLDSVMTLMLGIFMHSLVNMRICLLICSFPKSAHARLSANQIP